VEHLGVDAKVLFSKDGQGIAEEQPKWENKL
jgi:hypothetical protein